MDTVIYWIAIFGALCVASWGWLQVGLFVLIGDALMTACGALFALLVIQGQSPIIACLLAGALGCLIVIVHNFLVINIHLDEIVVGIAINLICVGSTRALIYWGAEATSISFDAAQIASLANFSTGLLLIAVMSSAVFVYLIRYSGLWPMVAAIEQNPGWAREAGVSVLVVKWLVVGCGAVIIIMDAMLRVTVNKSIAADQWTDSVGFLAIGVAFFAKTGIRGLLALSLLYSVPQGLSTQGWVRQALGLHIADFLPVAIVLISMFVIAFTKHLRHRAKLSDGR
jgi:general nucleoside transport system permease protein